MMFNEMASCPNAEPEVVAYLTRVWQESLRLESLGCNDSFLSIGGDSLAAMFCISRIRNHYGVEFSVEDFFLDDSTISQQANLITELIKQRRIIESTP